MPDAPDKAPLGTGITGAAESGRVVIDRPRLLPGDPWDAPGADCGDVGDGTGGAAPPVIEGDNRWLSGGEPPDNFAMSGRDVSGRFVSGNTAGVATQFQPGRSGNPAGRPRGSFRAGTRAAAALLDAQAEVLTEKLVEMALGGDPVAVRFCLARLLGTRRGQPVELDLPPVAAPADLAGAVTAVAAAIGEGSLTPEEGMHLSRMLAGFPRALAPNGSTNGAAGKQRSADEDPYEKLIQELDRLAARIPREERRARLLEELTALDNEADPGPLDVSVAEDQEQDEDQEQNAANPEPAAIAVTPISPAASPEQQQDQHDQNNQAHVSPRFFRPPSGVLMG